MQQIPNPPLPSDAKREGLEHLMLGSESWNQYRRTHPGPLDMSGVKIGSEFRKRYGLNDDNDVYLPRLDMSWVNLSNAELRRCVLDSSNFLNANLSGADLTRSSIVDAHFDGATLEGTFMFRAKCYRSRFPYGALRNAYLFMEPNSQRLTPNIDPKFGVITSLPDLIANLKNLEPMMKQSIPWEQTRLFYRGHDDYSWDLTPSVLRKRSNLDAESVALTEFMARNPEIFTDGESLLSQMVKAREYGLPTRLLDITSNPLVAMFFAVNDDEYVEVDGALHLFGIPQWMVKSFNSDTVALICAYARLGERDQRMLTGIYDRNSQDAVPQGFDAQIDHMLGSNNFRWNETLDRILGEVIKHRHHFSNRIDPFDFFKVFAVTPRFELRRLRDQSGAFLLSGFHQRFERNSVIGAMMNTPIYEHRVFTIPAGAKMQMRDDLERLNISKETMLSSPEVSADAIRKRYGFE